MAKTSFKNFLKNKNTVTVLGVIACIAILAIGYNSQIDKKTNLVTVYYANQSIQPKTLITPQMISKGQVPAAFLNLGGTYFTNPEDIVGKYSNYNTVIAKGSLFYTELLIEEKNLPDAIFYDVNEGERVVSFPVNTSSTYGNSIMPGNKVDIYVKLINDRREIVYGQFYEKIEVLGVKDSAGNNVFENTGETRTPAYVYFSLEEAKYLLFSSLQYVKEYYTGYQIEIVLVPNTVEFEAEDVTATEVTSDYLYDFTVDKIEQIDEQRELYNQLINEMEQQKIQD